MNKGLIYTTFALLSSSLLLIMALLPVTTPVENNHAESTRIGEASFFLESVLSDMDRSLSMATRRSLTASTNYIVTNGKALVEPEKNVTSALVNGSISEESLENMENVSLTAWTERVSGIAEDSGYSLSVSLVNHSINSSGFHVKSSYRVFARLKDPITFAAFNKTQSAETKVAISDLEDPMLLLQSKGRYVSKYSNCGFDKPAEKLYVAGTYSSGSAQGQSVVNPSDISAVSNKGEKIVVASDIEAYSTDSVNNFAGAVSAADNDTKSGYTTEYAFNTGSISDIGDNTSLILNNGQVWNANFRDMFLNNCYVETDRGPDFTDRMSNELVSQDGGLATMVYVSELPSELRKTESAVGYVYFNETGNYGSLNRIKGVSDEYAWFRLDDYHVGYWGLGDLAY